MILCIYVRNVSDMAACPYLSKYRNIYYKQTKIHWPLAQPQVTFFTATQISATYKHTEIHWPPSQPQVTFFAATQISATTKHKPNIGHVLRRDANLSHIQTHRNILATGSATGHILRSDANLSHIQTHRNILATGSATGHVLRCDENLSHIQTH